MMRYILLLSVLFAGCDAMMGSKQDPVTDEIFTAGKIDPTQFQEVEYVPLFPFFQTGGDGLPLDQPTDVYVGYDELVYITDARGLHVLDQAGRPATFLPLPGGGTNVIQDRRLHVYVTARRDTFLNGQNWSLPVIYRWSGIASGSPTLERTIWHPFDDDSRRFNLPDPIATDEAVAFTGIGILPNNNVYVARRGPVNDRTSIITAHNTVLQFTPEGVNIQAILALNPNIESLRSAIDPADVATFVHPPQREQFTDEQHFVLLQGADNGPRRYGVLSIIARVTSDGIVYEPDTRLVGASARTPGASGYLYDPFQFADVSGITIAADNTGYWFVTDRGKDSLFVFTSGGVEGVQPPAGIRSTIPIRVSFGGTGDGAMQFDRPEGVAYFQRLVYVADRGNNRISRFRLNTDFE